MNKLKKTTTLMTVESLTATTSMTKATPSTTIKTGHEQSFGWPNNKNVFLNFLKRLPPASFCLFSFFSSNFYTILERDLNSDRQRSRQAHWPPYLVYIMHVDLSFYIRPLSPFENKMYLPSLGIKPSEFPSITTQKMLTTWAVDVAQLI